MNYFCVAIIETLKISAEFEHIGNIGITEKLRYIRYYS